MPFYKKLVYFAFLVVTSTALQASGEIGFSFAAGYGSPLPFQYAGYTVSNKSSYKEIWSSFGNGLKLNLQTYFPASPIISIIFGFDATLFGSCVISKTSDNYHYNDNFNQTLGGVYVGIESFGYIRRFVLSLSLEPGIYYPYNVTVLRQRRIDDKYLNNHPFGDVISNYYRCYYDYTIGFSSTFKLGYKISQKSFIFISVRPSIIHARAIGYRTNVDGIESYYSLGNNMPLFAYPTSSEIQSLFPFDFSSISFSIGVNCFGKNRL